MDVQLETERVDALAADVDLGAPEAQSPYEVQHAAARLLEYERGRHVALPVHTTMEVVERPVIIEVPGAPYYALGMMRWQDRWIPVIDLHTLLEAYQKPSAPPKRHVVVVAYQRAPRRPLEYGAIATVSLPRTVQVHDGQACALPPHSDLWPLIADSCFSENGQFAIPIVNTTRLFEQVWD
jgi:chemotaxis signal transduction protein